MAKDTLRGHTGGDGNLGSGREARPTAAPKVGGRRSRISLTKKRKYLSANKIYGGKDS